MKIIQKTDPTEKSGADKTDPKKNDPSNPASPKDEGKEKDPIENGNDDPADDDDLQYTQADLNRITKKVKNTLNAKLTALSTEYNESKQRFADTQRKLIANVWKDIGIKDDLPADLDIANLNPDKIKESLIKYATDHKIEIPSKQVYDANKHPVHKIIDGKAEKIVISGSRTSR